MALPTRASDSSPSIVMDALHTLVWQRAGGRCEYCKVHQHDGPYYPFPIEHIIARQHRGSDDPRNRALTCYACNEQT